MFVLANHANKDGECWITYANLATECELTKRFVIMAIKDLQNLGLILKKKRVHSNKRSRSNLYKILPDFVHNVINKGELTSPIG